MNKLQWTTVLLGIGLERGVEIRQTGDKLPFFLWCRDNHEAVFGVLHEHSENEREVAFRTRDGSLIEHTFEVKFEAFWKQASKAELVTIQGHSEPNWLPNTSSKPSQFPPVSDLKSLSTAVVPKSSPPSPQESEASENKNAQALKSA